jgi:hypothetical protein
MNNQTDPLWSASSDDPFVRLNITEMRAMAALDPGKLLRWIEDSESAFILGVEQFEENPDRWGGLFQLTIQRNLEFHFLPDFNTAMLDESELPQFCIMPHPLKSDTVSERSMVALEEDEGESQKALIFFITPEDFQIYIQELEELVKDWNANPMDKTRRMSFPFLPESYFRDFDMLEWLKQTVLSHPTIQKQRAYDGRRGYPVIAPTIEADLEDIPAPHISEHDDDEEEEDWETLEQSSKALDEAREQREEEWLDEQRRQEGY